MLTYAADQMKKNNNAAGITDAACLCAKKSFEDASTTSLILIPSNFDFGREGRAVSAT